MKGIEPQHRTEVCITVDTEFSIAGHFNEPDRFKPLAEPVVYGEIDGKQHGLGFLLDTFEKYRVSATFFVECANQYYFGDAPMQKVVKQLIASRQDVQLHIHPVWLSFNTDPKMGSFPRNDDCTGRSFDELGQAFDICINIFKRWVGHAPLAIRTGSLRADDNIYKVMSKLGIPMASNLALGIYQPGDTSLQFNSGRHRIHNVMELPVFTYQDMSIGGRRHRKSLQITSCSWPEMKRLLWSARRQGVENIVILTHPFEYIKKADSQYSKLTRNRVNQQRLLKLCQFITEHDQDFVTADFTSHQQQWCVTELKQADIVIPTAYAIGRKLHNKINDSIWCY